MLQFRFLAAPHQYSYRLCKKPASGNYSELTEECFQRLPLNFFGKTSFIHFMDGRGSFEFDAMFTTEGTFPPGSMWAKDPVPPLGHGPVPWQPKDGTTQFPTPTLHGTTVPELTGTLRTIIIVVPPPDLPYLPDPTPY